MDESNISSKKIYWANTLFTEADRRFNIYCTDILRRAGFNVFLPQEAPVNDEKAPTAKDIFNIDTREIICSDLLIACLDQETIDCGVACEIGIAFAFGIPVIGFYTDIRQYRSGSGHMYKNLYVLGAIEDLGEITNSLEELQQIIPRFLNRKSETNTGKKVTTEFSLEHYEGIADSYDAFIEKLESWYNPPWTSTQIINKYIKILSPKSIIEFGCGTGKLGHYITEQNNQILYTGFDISQQMINIAQQHYQKKLCNYSSNLSDLVHQTGDDCFDLSIMLFALHDVPDQNGVFSDLVRHTHSGGHILIMDLSIHDLPGITKRLKYGLSRPAITHDTRIEPVWIANQAEHFNLQLIECNLITTGITFPTCIDLDNYFEEFGIYRGMDLPLNLSSNEEQDWKSQIRDTIKTWSFPLSDRRSFIVCLLKKL